MKKTFLLLVLLCHSVLALSQFLTVPGFSQIEQIPCPFDANATIAQPLGWRLYQTTSGNWEGPVDSTRCISVTKVSGNAQVDLGQLNPTEPLFVRARLDIFPPLSPFEANYVYSFLSSVQCDTALLQFDPLACNQDLCTGVFLGIAIPDAAGNPGAATRFQTGFFSPYSTVSLNCSTCFPTEYFFDQRLREVILKFTFKPGVVLAGKTLRLDFANLDPTFSPPGLVTAVNATPFQFVGNNTFEVNIQDAADPGGFFVQNFLLHYDETTYPSAPFPSYVEGQPMPNLPTPQTINLVVDPFQTLDIQPYVYLRGGLVENSSTLRHQLNLVNLGGDICLNFTDVIFEGGEYRHGGGRLDMNNAFSCFQFRKNSALRVLEGATLRYGNQGAGMLALCAGSALVLERDATLVVDCLMNLAECDDALPPQQLYMDLPPGARLVFTDKAWLTNRFSQNREMRLNVRMLGGTIDDTALDAEERALIRRIYPEPAPDFTKNVQVYPNPFATEIQLQYLAAQDEVLQLVWTDIQGRVVLEESRPAQRGINVCQVQAPQMAGFYTLHVQGQTGSAVLKLLKTTP